MSRRRAANRRGLLLPLRMPDRYPTGVVFELCVPGGSTETIRGKTEEPARHATRRRPAQQTTQPTEGPTAALIAGNHLLAQLVFQRIRPRTRRETTSEQTSSPHELQRTRSAVALPDVLAPAVTCADVPVPEAIPSEIETLFTQLARRRLRKPALQETK